MPTVELSDATFKRLQAHAKPLIDTTSSVIDRLLDHYECDRQRHAPKSENGPAGMLRFDPADLPSLTHTKLRRAVLDGRELPRPNWNELARIAIETGLERLGGFEQLSRITDARIVKGTKTDEGYSPLGTTGISVQGADAMDAWRITLGLARKLSMPVEVVFEWREKEGAAHPGATGTTGWHPPK